MNKLRIKWMYGGALIIALVSSLGFIFGELRPSPLFPLPFYQVILACLVSLFFIAFMPLIYLLEVKFVSQSQHFSKIVVILILVLAMLNALYIWQSWSYGYAYQGELHTKVVAIENIIGFCIAMVISGWSLKNRNINATYVANFMLFSLLSWCAFPYLGELAF